MVGVAGRSKGCTTCKKRKVRCDLQKPACGNCIKGRRECEGYDKPLVFIRRGPLGYVSNDPPGRRPSPASQFRIGRSNTGVGQGSSFEFSEEDGYTSDQPVDDMFLPLQLSSKSADDSFLFAAFMNVWAPHENVTRSGSWIVKCADLCNGTDNSLAISLRCLSLVRCARTWKDERLITRGRETYSRALSMLQAELLNDKVKYSEEVMASCRVLSTYEFLESTSDGINGWITHMQGMEKVVFLRGSQRFKNSLNSGALLDWRANAMIRSIIQRRASFLSVEKWQSQNLGSDMPAERMYDLGLSLGALLEKADRAAGGFGGLQEEQVDTFNLHASIGVIKSLQALDDCFDDWFVAFCRDFRPPFWIVPDYAPVGRLRYGIYSFPDLRVAIFVSTYWTIKVLLSDAIEQLGSRLAHERQKGLAAELTHSLEIVDAVMDKHNGAYRKKYAIDVIRATPYCLGLSPEDPEPEEIVTGLSAAQRCLFTLGMALRVMFRFELGREYARGSLLFAYLIPRISFAANLHQRFQNVAGDAIPDPHEILRNLPPEEPEPTEPSQSSFTEGNSPLVEFTRDGYRSHQEDMRCIERSMTRLHQQKPA